ncbi:sigma factor [Microbispora rosea]|uniref:sigma factor n=1 Tax=Microbispora rosea TaxID=58117 RepID=UPI00068DF9E6|nr:sigma factor [Microbispora rosea]
MELLEAVRGGDTAAFGTLYRRHSAAARSLARQVVQGEDAVEDLLAETFARVLEAMRRGGGPACAFRPYLLASVRRYAAAGVADLADGDSLYVDPELTGLERSPLARAYRSLPERWRALLWHVEIEGGRPADAGPLLGLSGRAAALLTRRARQGLREAYLRLHLENGPRAECRPILSMILRYVENGLPKQEAGAVDAHVAECIDCRSVFLQLVDLTQELRAVVGQLIAGPAVDDYLADLATAAATGPRSYGGGVTGGSVRGGGVRGRVGAGARARLEAVRHHIGALTSRADRRIRGGVRVAQGETGPVGRTRDRVDGLLRGAYGRARTATRRACARVSAAPGAVYGRARVMTRRVSAKVGPRVSKVGPKVVRAPRVAFARARAALARLSALVRSVPTPHRAVLGGVAVAALVTAAFLLVAQPTGVLFTGGPGGQDGTRALDRPQPADSAASRSRAATGHTEAAGVPSPYDPRRSSAQASPTAVSAPTPQTADDPVAGSGADGWSGGIALGMPEITGRVTPGADRRSPQEEPAAQADPARAGDNLPVPRRDDGRPAASGAEGREGGQHAGAGRESGRLTGGGQGGIRQGGSGQTGRGQTGRGQGGSAQADRGQDSRGQGSRGQAGRRPVSEPDTTTVVAGRERDSRPGDAAGASAPERQQVRGRLSRRPYQDHRAQAPGQAGVQGGGQARSRDSVQGGGQARSRDSAQGGGRARSQGTGPSSALVPGQGGVHVSGQARSRDSAQGGGQARSQGTGPNSAQARAQAQGRAQTGARQTPERARERHESQAGGPATDRTSPERPGTAQGRRQAADRGREAREHARAGQSGTGAHEAAQSGRTAESGKKAKQALVAAVDPLGALLRGQSGLVAVRLRNAGGAATGEVAATVTLPPGVRYLGQDGRDARGRAAGDGWSCGASGRSVAGRTMGQTVRCVRGPLAAGEVTAIFLKVAVAADASTGRAITVRIRSGRLETTATSTVGVRSSGAAARFAADGRLLARVVGNALVSSAGPAVPCGVAAGGRGRDSGTSVPVDLDRDPSTRTSSCADLDLPAGSRVLWAGLYWSGGGRGAVPAGDIRVRAPGAPGYATLHAAEVTRRDLPAGSGYQAFADVTSLVRTAGGGRWWVAGAPARTGPVRHAAWGLVVMAEDARQPYTRAVVLDAAAVIGSEEKALRLPLDGLAPDGAPARIDLMVWNGEGVRAGVVTMSDRARGDGEDRSREGVLGEEDAGGVAVDTLHALLGPHPALQLATRRDPVFFGVAVVSARTWS